MLSFLDIIKGSVLGGSKDIYFLKTLLSIKKIAPFGVKALGNCCLGVKLNSLSIIPIKKPC
tara:strand:- start:304 stop:486 length:183 start_codon:yes stop_codon:yes gene_type:complete